MNKIALGAASAVAGIAILGGTAWGAATLASSHSTVTVRPAAVSTPTNPIPVVHPKHQTHKSSPQIVINNNNGNNGPAANPPVGTGTGAGPGLTPRGMGTNGEEVYANADTSTPFALTVESDYWSASGMTFQAYSAVTGQWYTMNATDNSGTVTITNSTGALVQFSD